MDSPDGQHLIECCGTTHNIEWYKRGGDEKLMTIGAIYIKNLKQQLNTHDEYRGAGMDFEILTQTQKIDF